MNRLSLIAIFILILASACQKIFEKPTWKTDIVAPLVKTSLGIENIFKDTSFVADGDTVKFISRDKLYDLNLDSLVKLQVKPFKKKVMLSTLKLEPQKIVRQVTLGELARAMMAVGNGTGALIKGSQGSSIPVDDINNLKAEPLPVDINQFFEYAVMNNPGGKMVVTIENGLPLDVLRLEFELRNSSPALSNPPIAHQIFENLNTNTSQTDTIDLSDKTMEGNMTVKVLDIDIKGGTVVVDTNDAVTITLSIYDVSVKEATAVFPEQDVVDEKNETSLTDLDDIRLRKVKIQSGMVYADVYSTAEDTIEFTYLIPSATKGGVPFVMKAIIRPASIAGPRQQLFADFKGYDLDLTGKLGHDTVNTFYNEIKGKIKYTGRKTTLSLKDSLDITVTLKDVVPSYIEGYLGRDTIDIGSGSADFDIFKSIQGGTLNFEKVKLNLVVENGLGLDGEFVLKNLQSVNSKTGQQRTLNGLPLTGIVQKANVGPGVVTTTIPITGSNLVDLLNIMPDKVTYNVELRINTQPFTLGNYPDFAHKGSPLNPYLDIELPLSILADQIVLSDTADFISENFKTSVNAGNFTVLTSNGFPVGGDLSLYFLDATGVVIDSVISSGSILPGIPNSQGRVETKMPSKVTFFVNEIRMQNVLRSRKIIFKVKFSTPNSGVPGSFVKLFSDYRMDFKIVGDFNYTIE